MKYLLSLIVTLVLISTCNAAIITIEADDFAAGTDMGMIYDDIRFRTYNFAGGKSSTIFALESSNPLGLFGDNSIGWQDPATSLFYEWWWNVPRLEIVIDNGFAYRIDISVTAKSGTIPGPVFVKSYNKWYEVLTANSTTPSSAHISNLYTYREACDIKYFKVYSLACFALDNIRIDYQPEVPEPSTIILLAGGLLFLRRRSYPPAHPGVSA